MEVGMLMMMVMSSVAVYLPELPLVNIYMCIVQAPYQAKQIHQESDCSSSSRLGPSCPAAATILAAPPRPSRAKLQASMATSDRARMRQSPARPFLCS